MIGMYEIDPMTEPLVLEQELGIPSSTFPVFKHLGMIVYKTVNGKYNIQLPPGIEPLVRDRNLPGDCYGNRYITTQRGIAGNYLLKSIDSMLIEMLKQAKEAYDEDPAKIAKALGPAWDEGSKSGAFYFPKTLKAGTKGITSISAPFKNVATTKETFVSWERLDAMLKAVAEKL